MLPLITALSGNNPISAIAVTDLPQPDSPIRPSVPPRASEKLTPRTASAGPRLVLSRTRKFSTSISGALSLITAPAPAADRTDPAAHRPTDLIRAPRSRSTGPDRPPASAPKATPETQR